MFSAKRDLDRLADQWMQNAEEEHARVLARRRGVLALIALRRYKNLTGHWPDTLDEIRPSESEGMQAGIQHSENLTYWLKTGGFELYCISQNNISEDDRYEWIIWPIMRMPFDSLRKGEDGR